MVKIKNETGTGGFTLVELLIAIFIFSLVIVAVYGTYRATFYTIDISTAELDKAKRARIALKRIADDLFGLATGKSSYLLGENTEENGSRVDKLSFVASSYLKIARENKERGYSMVKFFTEYDDESESFQLFRSSSLVLPGEETAENDAVSYLLCDRVKSIEFNYVDGDGTAEDEWQFDTEEQRLPVLVYVKLELYGKKGLAEDTSVFATAVSIPRLAVAEE